MGAWNYGIFDDDTSCDIALEIQEMEDPKDFFKASFETALESSYLDYDECHAVTVSAAYIDHLLNGTPYNDEENMSHFKTKFPGLLLIDLKPLAVSALGVVISEISELNELWAENEDLYPTWKENIQSLIGRLS
jgi:hypothetical protein